MNVLSKILGIGLIFATTLAYSHEGSSHENGHSKHSQDHKTINQINESYRKTIKPIFQKSCFDCHSSKTNFPWYYKIPGIKQLIDHDIFEAKVHLDMDNDFPFKGHGTNLEDLKAIGDSIKEGSMPPFRYRILHRDTVLNQEEKRQIREWVKQSLDLLEAIKEEGK